jgi:hypothetical protein
MIKYKNNKKVLGVVNAERLAYLAALAAIEAPVRPSAGSCARITWRLIIDIRAELEAIGFDWRTAATEHKRLEAERKYKAYGHKYANTKGQI